MFRPETGTWFVNRTTAGAATAILGRDGDEPVPADYDGDGKTDLAVFRPATAQWFIVESAASTTRTFVFGNTMDVPVPFLR